jgi:Mlc titration factor MtfA (ptsG expression regulator)
MGLIIFIAISLLLLILVLFFKIIFSLSEYNYGLFSNKPFYVHSYFKIKSLPANQFYVLSSQFEFYTSLSDKEKKYFEHRVVNFIEKYEFIGKEGFLITDEVKVLIASTAVMLTFGMRHYLFDVIERIVVYPNEYFSTTTEEYFKGEFNPRMKTVVFSWKDFKNGYELTSDNLNLGIHEFTHVLNFHGLRSEDASALIFTRMFKQINEDVNKPNNRQKLIESNYFRVYAYTNPFEFLAVIIEHFFESPDLFKQEFPELFDKVSKMLNFRTY